MICEQCGGELEYFEEGSSCGQRCPGCGLSIVTTKQNPIFYDKAIYTVSLLPGNKTDSPTLKTISKICNVNYIAAKKIIEGSQQVIFSGKAWDVLERKSILDKAEVSYEITPSFPHETAGGVRSAL